MVYRVLIAPDSFKGSLSASEAALAMAHGVERAAAQFGRRVRVDLCPMSDGGEGFAETVRHATHGRARSADVLDAAGRTIRAEWALCGPGAARRPAGGPIIRERFAETALALLTPWPSVPGNPLARVRTAAIESACAIGIANLDPTLRKPRALTSFGVGQLIGRALEAHAEAVVVGLGGSATCDGGIGMAQALGVRFELIGDPAPAEFEPGETPPQGPPLRASDLTRIRSIDVRGIHPGLETARLVAACDVDNPLFGEEGAACVFGPQKGATDEAVQILDEGLRHLARKCADAGLSVDPDAPGAGAAGGIGFALAAFFGARLESGASIVSRITRLRQRARKADLVITGEGRLDAQTAHGKTCLHVARAARDAGAPVIALVGSTGPGWERLTRGAGGDFDRVERITPAGTGEAAAMRDAASLLERATTRAVQDRLSVA